RAVLGGEDNDLVLQRGHVAESGAVLVVRPEVLPVGIENHRADRHVAPASLRHSRCGLVEIRKQQLHEVRLAEASSCEHQGPSRYKMEHLELRNYAWRLHLHPRFGLEASITAGIDELAQCEVPEFGRVLDVVASDLAKEVLAEESD